ILAGPAPAAARRLARRVPQAPPRAARPVPRGAGEPARRRAAHPGRRRGAGEEQLRHRGRRPRPRRRHRLGRVGRRARLGERQLLHVAPARPRGRVRGQRAARVLAQRLVSFLLVACVALVVAVEIVGGVALGAVSQLVARVGEWLGPGLPADLLGPVLDLGLLRLVTTTAGLTLAFRYLPRRGSTWLGALAGGGVAAVGILVVRSLLLLTFSPERFNLVYGVITSLLAVLLWLYLALLILLVGAAVAAELSVTAGRRPAAPGAVAEPG